MEQNNKSKFHCIKFYNYFLYIAGYILIRKIRTNFTSFKNIN